MPLTAATQSVTPNALLDAVQTVLTFGNGVQPATGVDGQYISEVYEEYNPRSGEPYELTFSILPETPEEYSGAGRWGHNSFIVLEVRVYTRLELDAAGSDAIWSRDTTYGALRMRTLVNDLLQDQFLFTDYSTDSHLPTGVPLVIEGLQQLPSPRPAKPDRSTSAQGLDAWYGVHRLLYSCKTVQPLTR